ncbi:MAG: hypothetical protein MPW15_12235 [Candidatus Manganitrophus sp.]|nr:hypothetical protein [Candidatus Manganitrophus sp.]
MRIDRLDIADLPHLFFPFHRLRLNQRAVFSGETDPFAAMPIDEGDDFFVDRSSQDHLDDLHRLGIGDADPFDELRLFSEPLHHPGDLRAAPMNDHRVHPDIFHQDDIFGELGLERFFGHRRPAVFDDDRLSEEGADIRQRLDENLGFIVEVAHRPGPFP